MIGKPGAAISHISQAYPDRVEVRGRDLTGDLMGRLSFTEYFHLLLTGEEPTEDQRYFLDLLLVAIAEHGMMPTNVAARMTLAADPGSLQGAVAAGILGCGPVILGTAEECARLLEEAQRGRPTPEQRASRAIRDAGGKLPGFGHPVHRPLDPRAERILELADERGVSGPHVALARAFRDAAAEAWGKPLTMNVSMPIAAVHARPRVPGGDRQGGADPRPHRRAARPSGRGAGASRSASSWPARPRRRSSTSDERRRAAYRGAARVPARALAVLPRQARAGSAAGRRARRHRASCR